MSLFHLLHLLRQSPLQMFHLRRGGEGQEQILEVASVLIGTVQTQRDCNVDRLQLTVAVPQRTHRTRHVDHRHDLSIADVVRQSLPLFISNCCITLDDRLHNIIRINRTSVNLDLRICTFSNRLFQFSNISRVCFLCVTTKSFLVASGCHRRNVREVDSFPLLSAHLRLNNVGQAYDQLTILFRSKFKELSQFNSNRTFTRHPLRTETILVC